MYTSLIINKVDNEYEVNEVEALVEYYIRVKSIKINSKTVKFNSTR